MPPLRCSYPEPRPRYPQLVGDDDGFRDIVSETLKVGMRARPQLRERCKEGPIYDAKYHPMDAVTRPNAASTLKHIYGNPPAPDAGPRCSKRNASGNFKIFDESYHPIDSALDSDFLSPRSSENQGPISKRRRYGRGQPRKRPSSEFTLFDESAASLDLSSSGDSPKGEVIVVDSTAGTRAQRKSHRDSESWISADKQGDRRSCRTEHSADVVSGEWDNLTPFQKRLYLSARYIPKDTVLRVHPWLELIQQLIKENWFSEQELLVLAVLPVLEGQFKQITQLLHGSKDYQAGDEPRSVPPCFGGRPMSRALAERIGEVESSDEREQTGLAPAPSLCDTHSAYSKAKFVNSQNMIAHSGFELQPVYTNKEVEFESSQESQTNAEDFEHQEISNNNIFVNMASQGQTATAAAVKDKGQKTTSSAKAGPSDLDKAEEAKTVQEKSKAPAKDVPDGPELSATTAPEGEASVLSKASEIETVQKESKAPEEDAPTSLAPSKKQFRSVATQTEEEAFVLSEEEASVLSKVSETKSFPEKSQAPEEENVSIGPEHSHEHAHSATAATEEEAPVSSKPSGIKTVPEKSQTSKEDAPNEHTHAAAAKIKAEGPVVSKPTGIKIVPEKSKAPEEDASTNHVTIAAAENEEESSGDDKENKASIGPESFKSGASHKKEGLLANDAVIPDSESEDEDTEEEENEEEEFWYRICTPRPDFNKKFTLKSSSNSPKQTTPRTASASGGSSSNKKGKGSSKNKSPSHKPFTPPPEKTYEEAAAEAKHFIATHPLSGHVSPPKPARVTEPFVIYDEEAVMAAAAAANNRYARSPTPGAAEVVVTVPSPSYSSSLSRERQRGLHRRPLLSISLFPTPDDLKENTLPVPAAEQVEELEGAEVLGGQDEGRGAVRYERGDRDGSGDGDDDGDGSSDGSLLVAVSNPSSRSGSGSVGAASGVGDGTSLAAWI